MSDNRPSFVPLPPSPAFIGASWLVLATGIGAYSVWLWNATMAVEVKYFYWIALMLALFAAVSISKTVRDKEEDIPVTNLYYGLCWVAVGVAVLTFGWVLWSSDTVNDAQKGFLAMSYLLSMFAAVAVQKNTRDVETYKKATTGSTPSPRKLLAEGKTLTVPESARNATAPPPPFEGKDALSPPPR